MYHQLYKAVWL